MDFLLCDSKFSMFESPKAFWEWLTGGSGAVYIGIIIALAVLLICAVVFACVKKARVRKNDVNVLMLLGESEDSVKADIFKKNYAMVLLAKSVGAAAVKETPIELPEPLTDDEEEIVSDDVEEPQLAELALTESADDDSDDDFDLSDTEEEFIEEDNIEAGFAENIDGEENEEEPEISEYEESEIFTDSLAVQESEDEIPFNEQDNDAEEAEVDELVQEETAEEVIEDLPEEILEEPEVIEEEIDELPDDEQEDIGEEEPDDILALLNAEEPADACEAVEEEFEEAAEPEETYEAEEVFSEEEISEPEELHIDSLDADTENIIIAPIAVSSQSREETIAEPLTDEKDDAYNTAPLIYEIDASDTGVSDRVEIVNYMRIENKVTGRTTVENTELEPLKAEEIESEQVKEAPVSEELFLIEIETEAPQMEVIDVEDAPDEIIEETSAPTTAEESAPEVVEFETEEAPVEEPIIVETEEAIPEAEETSAQEAAPEEIEEALIGEAASDSLQDTAAYVIVKEEEAVPEAIEAVQNGEIIVDANGDGIAAEVLVDKNILKARYKTVDLETRIRRADESTKVYYSEIKNFLLSYKGVKSRISKKFDTFTIGRFIVAKMAIRGNVINLYLALASESVDDKYFAEDVGDSDTYGKTPTLHKVKSKRGCKYGIELIRDIMSELQIPANEDFVPVDYAAEYPPENIEEKKDAIRHMFKNVISVEEAGVLSDEEALEFIEIVKNKQYTINKFLPINKFVVFVDDIDKLYQPGETVTINDLIEKEALPNEENIFLEIRAKGSISKSLTVEAHSFDPEAIKMIILTDGKVIQYK